MTLVRINPARSFEKATKKMNEFFNEVEKGINLEVGGFSPRVDIVEDEKHLYFYAEVPGIPKENVKISVNEENLLVIKGEKPAEEKKENKTYLRTERSFGTFSRSFMLPENIDRDKISAKYQDGMLEVRMEKIAPPEPREVEIKVD